MDERATDRALLETLADDFLSGAPDLGNPARDLLEDHFGSDPATLPIASDSYTPIVNVHLQNAIEEFVSAPGREYQLRGLAISTARIFDRVSLSELVCAPTLSLAGASVSSPDFVSELESTGRRSVLRRGLYLVRDKYGPLAIWVCQGQFIRAVEVMAPTRYRAQAIVDKLRSMSYHLNPFKGQVITITIDCPGNVTPVYLERPSEVAGDEVVLPAGLLERIERQALGVSDEKEVMLEAGHALERGVLLHGRPGTGKTHTIRYLISRMPDHTVLIVPAARMELVTDRLAEIISYITPGIIVFDDVDLIAEDRSVWVTQPKRGPLFTLLDLMDGIKPDADLLFILATNVAERIDEAIAARPGRVDQAFEIPLPDRYCRQRLFDLYAASVTKSIDDMGAILDRTEGVTGSFLMELVRRAVVIAMLEDDEDDDYDYDDYEDDDEFDYDADEDDEQLDASYADVVITDDHVHAALDQLLKPDSDWTTILLGAPLHQPEVTLGQLAAALQRR